MDAWNDDFTEPTEDERSARRALGLAIALINERSGLSTTQIRRNFYAELSDSAFRKAFLRDRTRLATSGLIVRSRTSVADEKTWEMDEERSFVHESRLRPSDALMLDCLLMPLARDPSYPFARDLRHALTKIDRSFDGTSIVSIPPEARRRNIALTHIEDAMMNRHAIRAAYTKADGTQSERTLLPYGLFHLNDRTYLVAASWREDTGVTGRPHTYAVERMGRVRELSRVSYDIPPDFDARDFIRLPFQMGPTTYVASFHVPRDRYVDVRHRVQSRGSWSDGGGLTLRCEVSQENVAATWAIAEGIRPIEPPSLVDAWRTQLIRTVGGDDDGATEAGELGAQG